MIFIFFCVFLVRAIYPHVLIVQCLIFTECNCHGKALSCVYNATVDSLGLSINMEGKYQGGGVCQNCQVNFLFYVAIA